jgi:hypothetical protein
MRSWLLPSLTLVVLPPSLRLGVLVTRVGRFVLALVTVVLLVGLLIGFPMARQFGARS